MAAAAARLKPISFQPHFLPSTLFPLSNPMRSNSDGANKTGEAEWREADALEKKIPLTVPMHVSKLPPVHSKLFYAHRMQFGALPHLQFLWYFFLMKMVKQGLGLIGADSGLLLSLHLCQ